MRPSRGVVHLALGMALLAAASAMGCGGRSSHDGPSASSGATGGSAAGSSAVGGAAQSGAMNSSGNAGLGDPATLELCSARIDGPSTGYSCQGTTACACADSDVPECRTLLVCRNFVWTEERAACPPPPDDACAPTPELQRGQRCRVHEASCSFPGNVSCFCLLQGETDGGTARCGDATLSWYCGDAWSSPPCPVGVPDLGSPCEGDTRCGEPCFNPYARECNAGVWVRGKPRHECI